MSVYGPSKFDSHMKPDSPKMQTILRYLAYIQCLQQVPDTMVPASMLHQVQGLYTLTQVGDP